MNLTELRTCLAAAYTKFATFADYLQSPFLLAVRLYWGWQFVGTGRAKLADVSGFAAHFAEWGLPFPKLNVVLAGSTEMIGGLLLCVGLCSRLTAIPLIFTMIVAYLTAETEALHAFFSDPDKFVSATPFQFMFAAIIVLAFGPGAFSLDAWLFRKSGIQISARRDLA